MPALILTAICGQPAVADGHFDSVKWLSCGLSPKCTSKPADAVCQNLTGDPSLVGDSRVLHAFAGSEVGHSGIVLTDCALGSRAAMYQVAETKNDQTEVFDAFYRMAENGATPDDFIVLPQEHMAVSLGYQSGSEVELRIHSFDVSDSCVCSELLDQLADVSPTLGEAQ